MSDNVKLSDILSYNIKVSGRQNVSNNREVSDR